MTDPTHHAHPTDRNSQLSAQMLDTDCLTDMFERAIRDRYEHGHAFAFGGMETICAIAIARVTRLEKQLGWGQTRPDDERPVRARGTSSQRRSFLRADRNPAGSARVQEQAAQHELYPPRDRNVIAFPTRPPGAA